MDCSLPGSSIHGILQARTLEWIAISFSRGSSWLRDRIQVSQAHSLLSEPPGKQVYIGRYIGIYSRYIGRQLPYFCYYKHQWSEHPLYQTMHISFSKNFQKNYHMIQQFHTSGYYISWENWKEGLKGLFVHWCSQQHYSQWPKGGSN